VVSVKVGEQISVKRWKLFPSSEMGYFTRNSKSTSVTETCQRKIDMRPYVKIIMCYFTLWLGTRYCYEGSARPDGVTSHKTTVKEYTETLIPRRLHWIQEHNMKYWHAVRSRDNAVGTATGYGLVDWGVGVRVPVGSRISSSRHPNRLWGPPSLLFNGYRGLFPGGEAAGACSWPLTST
jgi:hypothetical protein